MFGLQGKYKNKNFNMDDESDRMECEKVLTKYGPAGRILKYTDVHTKEGRLYVAVLWVEPYTDGDFRE